MKGDPMPIPRKIPKGLITLPIINTVFLIILGTLFIFFREWSEPVRPFLFGIWIGMSISAAIQEATAE